MADKELTVFVVDLAKDAGSGYKYVLDVLAGKLLRGLKTDYVSVATFNGPSTNHRLADRGAFKGVNVLIDFETITYDKLQDVSKTLAPCEPTEENCDAFQALVFAFSLFQNTKGKVFTRNIVLVTAGLLPKSLTLEKLEAFPGLIKDLTMNGLVIATNEDWRSVVKHFAKGFLLSPEEAIELAENNPPVRKVRPLAAFKGTLTLGGDFESLGSDNYVPSQDDFCLDINVEMFPAAKAESGSMGAHEYVIDGKPVKTVRKTRHFIWKNKESAELDSDDETYEKQFIEDGECVPGFKFSNYDLLALDVDLSAAATLSTTASFDVLGFIKTSAVPYAFNTSETFFVLPEKESSKRNLVSYIAFCEALLDTYSSAYVRLVRKPRKEVEVGTLTPVKIRKNDKHVYAQIFSRLPFKEDEKTGRFPLLAKPNKSIDSLMESFVSGKTLDEDESDLFDAQTIENAKVTMRQNDSCKLPLPSLFNRDIFLRGSPAANRFNVYLRRLLVGSLSADNLGEFLESPTLFRDSIKKGTTMFNMNNCLGVNGPNELTVDSEATQTTARELVLALNVRYEKKHPKKPVKQDQSRGNYGQDEGWYDALPDFGLTT